MLKKSVTYLFCVILTAFLLSTFVGAEEAVFSDAQYDVKGFDEPSAISDGNTQTTFATGTHGTPRVTVSREGNIGGVYVIFDKASTAWTLSDKDETVSVQCGANGFLHEYVNVSEHFTEGVTELVLTFPIGTAISEIYVFSEGEIPDWVQLWQPPHEKADLLLIAAHGGDEHIFFAGVIPYYAIERQMNVQVAYLTGNSDSHERPHEILSGLWKAGIRNYPVFSDIPEVTATAGDRTDAKNIALDAYTKAGYSFDSFVEYITECIRRFKPIVIVSHDSDGENGNGTHVICADAIAESLNCSLNDGKYLDSVENYGTWMPEKVYLHLYPENKMTIDIDKQYESLGGKSPFEVSREAFECHKTQLWTWYDWMFGSTSSPINKASEIEKYSPCKYGLFHTTVGNDKAGSDFFQNTKSHAEKDQDLETQTVGTIAPVETLPSELTAPVVDTEVDTEDETSDDKESVKKPFKVDREFVIVAIVLVAVGICVAVIIFTVASSKTSVRSRRRKRAERRDRNK
ncbi:MAG: PIG-L family deacetylase [Clostridia bacterium]|nr:PIG-L family deacetylase [Clostridia bacterium]